MTTTDHTLNGNGHRPGVRLPQITPAVNTEAEEAVLGAAIRDPVALAWLSTHLTPDQFYRPAHRQIARVLAELFIDGVTVTPAVLLAVLAERGMLQDVGGGPFLHTLDAAANTSANVGFFGRRVLACARQRDAADQLVQLCQAMAEGMAVDDVAALGLERFTRLLEGSGDDGVGGPPELLAAVRETRDRRLGGDRLSWRLANLDSITQGIEPGLIVVAGRPGSGKSSAGLQLCVALGEQVRTGFVSYEMSRSQLGRRVLAMLGSVDGDTAIMSVDDPALGAARVIMEGLDLVFVDSHDDLDRMVGKLMALHAQQPLGLLVVDYAQLIPVAEGRYKNREQEVAAISRAMKRLQRRLDIPVVLLAQLNRDADGREPVLRDLRESGQLEQDADLVVFLHDDTERKATKVIVAKNRDGATGSTWLAFNRPMTSFADDPQALSA